MTSITLAPTTPCETQLNEIDITIINQFQLVAEYGRNIYVIEDALHLAQIAKEADTLYLQAPSGGRRTVSVTKEARQDIAAREKDPIKKTTHFRLQGPSLKAANALCRQFNLATPGDAIRYSLALVESVRRERQRFHPQAELFAEKGKKHDKTKVLSKILALA